MLDCNDVRWSDGKYLIDFRYRHLDLLSRMLSEANIPYEVSDMFQFNHSALFDSPNAAGVFRSIKRHYEGLKT